MTGPSPERMDAIRVCLGGVQPTIVLLARIARLDPETIARQAKREGWSIAEPSVAGLDHAARVSALAEKLIAEMEAIERAGQGAGYDKARIDAVSALTRALEKLGEFTQSGQNRKEATIRTDAELAGALRRIDERIVELAMDYAGELVARQAERAGTEPRR